MSTAATYVSATSFTVSGDLTAKFDPHRALLCNHSIYGQKICYVDYASYSGGSGLTTVNLISTESEALTSDLTSIDFSCIRPTSLGVGNLTLNQMLLAKGIRKGLWIDWYSNTQININPGIVYIDNGTSKKLCVVPAQLAAVTLTGITLSAWNYIYVNQPANGVILTATEFTISATAPTWDEAKKGWYKSDDATKRCIMFAKANASAYLVYFSHNEYVYQWTNNVANTALTLTTTYQVQTVDSPFPNIMVLLEMSSTANLTVGYSVLVHNPSDPDDNTVFWYSQVAQPKQNAEWIPIDANKQFSVKVSTSTYAINWTVLQFMFPQGFFANC